MEAFGLFLYLLRVVCNPVVESRSLEEGGY
jgi:hypothetical protein